MTTPSIALITGANTGIGYQAARGLLLAGAKVVLACRDKSKGEAARDSLAHETGNTAPEILVIDLASQQSIRDAAKQFLATHSALDILVNNAAVGLPQRLESLDGIELTFATNVLGYFLLTNLLLDSLLRAPAARVVNVSSKLAHGLDLNDLQFKKRAYDATAAYAQSKHANRMLTWALARRLEGTHATANAMTPGPVNTQLLKTLAPSMKGKTTAEGADTIVWLATSAEVAGLSNRFWADRKEERCAFHNPGEEDKLWEACEAMISRTKPA